jgi:hypothetical protein
LISSIITTNRKSTATAPTYTIKSIIAKNSAFNIIKIIAELKKQRIKNKTEWIGFFEIITSIVEITRIDENKKNKKFIKFLNKKNNCLTILGIRI